MKYEIHSFRHAEIVLDDEKYRPIRDEVFYAISSITDEEIIARFTGNQSSRKSLSIAINSLIRDRLLKTGWKGESPIFQDKRYSDERWRLDFAKATVSLEVAFNHGEAIAWNLLKPVLASELNHVQKAIQTEVGIIICATREMKEAGGFDSAVGEFEKFMTYLVPLQDVLTVPMLIIGLKKPDSFRITHTNVGGRNIGNVLKY